MNKMLLTLTLLGAGLHAADSFGQPGRLADDRRDAVKHGWMFDYDEARQLAKKSGRPLMVVFRCVP